MGEYGPSPRTLRNLAGVTPRLVRCVMRAYQLTHIDFGVLDGGGLRTHAQAQQNFQNGTGVLNSRHLPQAPDLLSAAVDLVLFVGGKQTYDVKLYRQFEPIMLRACDEEGIPIQHGADWDMDGITGEKGEWDWPHWQLPWPHKLKIAEQAMQRRILARAS